MERDIEKQQIQRLMQLIKESAVADRSASDHPLLKDKKQLKEAKVLLRRRAHSSRASSWTKPSAAGRTPSPPRRGEAKNTSLTDPKRLADMARRLDDVIEGLKPEHRAPASLPRNAAAPRKSSGASRDCSRRSKTGERQGEMRQSSRAPGGWGVSRGPYSPQRHKGHGVLTEEFSVPSASVFSVALW